MFSKKTVDSVIGGLSKMITDLEEVEQQQQTASDRQRLIMLDATKKIQVAEDEMTRASSIATKIKALIE